MKVLHINTYDNGGAAIACIRLHLALLQNGVDSTLVTLEKKRDDIPAHFSYAQLVRKPRKNGLGSKLERAVLFGIKKWENRRTQEARKKLRELEQEAAKTTDCFSFITTPYRVEAIPDIEQFDIINLHWVANFLNWESFFSSPKIKNVVWTLHDMNPFTGGYHYAGGYAGYKKDDDHPPFLQHTFDPAFAKKQLQKKKEILGQTKVRLKIVTPSQWLGACSLESTVFSKYEHRIIPYSLNVQTFRNLDQEFCKEALNIPKYKKAILFVSDYLKNQRKGFKLLLDAVVHLDKEQYTFCCIGHLGPIVEPGPGWVHLGKVTDERVMALAYNAADVFVLPSKEDNLPNVVLESLCCGTPVVGFSIGGMTDMIVNGENGVLSTQISPEELAKSIQAVLDNPGLFNRKRISEEAILEYAPEIQARAYKELYSSF